MSEEKNEENEPQKKPKTILELFIEKLKQLLEMRSKRRLARKQLRTAQRFEIRTEKLRKKLEAAKAEEAAATDDDGRKAAAANVDRLEAALSDRKAPAESYIGGLKLECEALYRAHTSVARKLELEFESLVRLGKINKKNANDVIPTCRRCGLDIGSVRKRSWARKWFK